MTEISRAQRFDGFDRPTAAAVPESGLDRILEALTRCRRYVPQAIETKLAELWDRDTALAFAVLLGVWAGLQFTPAGWLADLLLATYGLATVGGDLVDLVLAAKGAADAATDADLENAAQQMASALTESAADVIAAVLGGVLFAKLRRLVRLSRAKLLPRRFAGGEEARLTLGNRLVSTAGGVSLVSGAAALAEQKKKIGDPAALIGWGVAIAGGVVLVAGVAAISRRGASQ